MADLVTSEGKYFDAAQRLNGNAYADILIAADDLGLASDPVDRQKQAFFCVWYPLYRRNGQRFLRGLLGSPATLVELEEYLGISRQTLGQVWPKTDWFERAQLPTEFVRESSSLLRAGMRQLRSNIAADDGRVSNKAIELSFELYKIFNTVPTPDTAVQVNIDNRQQNLTPWQREIYDMLQAGSITTEDVINELGSDLAAEFANAAGIDLAGRLTIEA